MTIKYIATIIGSTITVVCFATTWTFIVPILTIFPIGLQLELLFSEIFPDANYSTTSSRVLVTLFGLSILTGIWFYKRINKDKIEKRKFNTIRLIFFFIIQIFIIHPLIFYTWATMNAGNAGDGQFTFGIIETFPISSLSFGIIGIFVDRYKNKEQEE
ncbi:MAG: uncharacterized membrane protein YozB (DUF420 family) [Bacteroidia bacterium]|jgi:uncharacterized membrane protein YozB (DUF420 family)